MKPQSQFVFKSLTKMKSIIIPLIFIIRFISGYQLEFIEILKDLIEHEESPSNIVINSCWSLENLTHLRASLPFVGIQFEFGPIHFKEEKLAASLIVFVVDLNCPNDDLDILSNKVFESAVF